MSYTIQHPCDHRQFKMRSQISVIRHSL